MLRYTRVTHNHKSAVISQLVYSAGGSSFAGANGSMMIEVVVCPFSISKKYMTMI